MPGILNSGSITQFQMVKYFTVYFILLLLLRNFLVKFSSTRKPVKILDSSEHDLYNSIFQKHGLFYHINFLS